MTRAAVATLATAATAIALPASAHALALSVTTGSPQDVAATQATLRATVSVSALGGNVVWQYGTTTRYGTTSTAVATGLLGVNQTLTLTVTGLAPNTAYHVRAVATSGLSTAYGRDVSFTTASSGSGSGSGDGSGETSDPAPSTPGAGSTSTPSLPTVSTVTSTIISGTTGSGSGTSGSPSSSSSGKATTPDADGTPSADDGATVAPGVATATVTPSLGKTLGVAAVQGTVTATSPSGAPLDLGAAKIVPTGTVIDARAGTAELKTALDRRGATQTGRFWGAVFEVRQSASAHGMVALVLRGGDFSHCKTTNKAVARAAASKTKHKRKTTKKKPPRSLWGSDNHGRFQTRGRGSVATVRGTKWLTQDTCAGTLTRVAAGAVAVRDLRRHRTVVVARGHQYLARMTP
ncbi:hypothetical protein [Baekduia sp.]|jgi:hypothetical protein|uniref:hypothetical protein n=1 Tax=Baekduia sp. TaxID=2600305 RepID=UPI002DF95E3C|nr:hypothetical protein [Baekduia sp.]